MLSSVVAGTRFVSIDCHQTDRTTEHKDIGMVVFNIPLDIALNHTVRCIYQ